MKDEMGEIIAGLESRLEKQADPSLDILLAMACLANSQHDDAVGIISCVDYRHLLSNELQLLKGMIYRRAGSDRKEQDRTYHKEMKTAYSCFLRCIKNYREMDDKPSYAKRGLCLVEISYTPFNSVTEARQDGFRLMGRASPDPIADSCYALAVYSLSPGDRFSHLKAVIGHKKPFRTGKLDKG